MATHNTTHDQDLEKGAVEGTQPAEHAHANSNAPGLDENGQPVDDVAISQDVIGANADGTEG